MSRAFDDSSAPPPQAPDMVNHPPHYNNHPSGIEAIEVTRHMSFCLGNAFKYLFRHTEKNAPLEDLKKAAWYVNDAIENQLLPGGWVSSLEAIALMRKVDKISSFEPMPIRLAMRNIGAHAFGINATQQVLEEAKAQIEIWVLYQEEQRK